MKSIFAIMFLILNLVGCTTTGSKEDGSCNALFAKFFEREGVETVHAGFYGATPNPFTFVNTKTMEMVVYAVFDESLPESKALIDKYKAEYVGTCVVPDEGQAKFYRLKTRLPSH